MIRLNLGLLNLLHARVLVPQTPAASANIVLMLKRMIVNGNVMLMRKMMVVILDGDDVTAHWNMRSNRYMEGGSWRRRINMHHTWGWGRRRRWDYEPRLLQIGPWRGSSGHKLRCLRVESAKRKAPWKRWICLELNSTRQRYIWGFWDWLLSHYNEMWRFKKRSKGLRRGFGSGFGILTSAEESWGNISETQRDSTSVPMEKNSQNFKGFHFVVFIVNKYIIIIVVIILGLKVYKHRRRLLINEFFTWPHTRTTAQDWQSSLSWRLRVWKWARFVCWSQIGEGLSGNKMTDFFSFFFFFFYKMIFRLGFK